MAGVQQFRLFSGQVILPPLLVHYVYITRISGVTRIWCEWHKKVTGCLHAAKSTCATILADSGLV